MILRISMVFVICALASVAQISPRVVTADSERGANPPPEDLLRSAQKRFRPEVWSVPGDSLSVKPKSPYCIYPSLETQSIVFRRCPPANRKRLLPTLKLLPNSPAK
jgi:hypothetical protein